MVAARILLPTEPSPPPPGFSTPPLSPPPIPNCAHVSSPSRLPLPPSGSAQLLSPSPIPIRAYLSSPRSCDGWLGEEGGGGRRRRGCGGGEEGGETRPTSPRSSTSAAAVAADLDELLLTAPPPSASEPRSFPYAVKQQCWGKAERVHGRDPERWRHDSLGNVVFRKLVGCPGCLCHNYDHIMPYSKMYEWMRKHGDV